MIFRSCHIRTFKPPRPCLISSAFDDVDGWRTDPIWLNVKLILEIILRRNALNTVHPALYPRASVETRAWIMTISLLHIETCASRVGHRSLILSTWSTAGGTDVGMGADSFCKNWHHGRLGEPSLVGACIAVTRSPPALLRIHGHLVE
jgi:hypothetical protein